MKPYLLSLLFSMMCLMSSAQVLKPVSWDFEVSANDDATYTLTATAKMDDGWAVYSQHTPEDGPIPLSFTYESGEERIGETEEKSEAIKMHSELFDLKVIKFKKEAVFTQKFKPAAGQKSIKGYLTFMCCDDLRCLPPTDVAFDVTL